MLGRLDVAMDHTVRVRVFERLRLARVEQREDVRVLEVGRRLDLGEEPFGTDHCGQLGLEDLQGDLAFVLQVVGQVDRGHPAFAELTLDRVAALEGSVEARDGVGHGGQHAPVLGAVASNIVAAFRSDFSGASRSRDGRPDFLKAEGLRASLDTIRVGKTVLYWQMVDFCIIFYLTISIRSFVASPSICTISKGGRVSLNIKNLEAHRLARELAEATGESLTEAVTASLRERLASVQRHSEPAGLESAVAEIQDFVTALPDRDPRCAEEILGYDERGLPG